MYHYNCLGKYIIKFQCDFKKLSADDSEYPKKSNHIEKAFNDVIASLVIGTNVYELPDVRDMLNKKLKCYGKA